MRNDNEGSLNNIQHVRSESSYASALWTVRRVVQEDALGRQTMLTCAPRPRLTLYSVKECHITESPTAGNCRTKKTPKVTRSSKSQGPSSKNPP